MNTINQQLKKELIQAGAKTSEVSELTRIASSLSSLKRSTEIRRKSWARLFVPASFASAGLVIGIIIVMFAQSASPTSLLYPVQEVSDALAVKAHPDYRADVMMHRAQQVNELVKSHASYKVILATLNSYEAEAAGYKTMSHSSYAAFDYCKTNLQQAASSAPTNVRIAIINSLNSLTST